MNNTPNSERTDMTALGEQLVPGKTAPAGDAGKPAQPPLATTILTTIDSAVELAARARPERPQHPEATIAITTAEFDPADRRRRQRRRREAERSAVGRHISAPSLRNREQRRLEAERRSRPSVPGTRPPKIANPWVILLAASAGGLVGFVAWRYAREVYCRRFARP